ncbi:MAG: lamin tail domain-containing protein [Deltaproteobacteria bacterium]|nr:lamin tail domain-containing protein [Deltaproteobacteria bacterium]
MLRSTLKTSGCQRLMVKGALLIVLMCGCSQRNHNDVRDIANDTTSEQIEDSATDSTIDSETQGIESGLVINEVMSKNEGAWVDEQGETEDYVELYNGSADAISLNGYELSDGQGVPVRLPDITVPAFGRVLLFADADVAQGEMHLPFKLSSEGDTLTLTSRDGEAVDHVVIPPLRHNTALLRLPDGAKEMSECIWASPGTANGSECGTAFSPTVYDTVEFSDYTWPSPWPKSPEVTINEFRLLSDGFIELLNRSTADVNLSSLDIRLLPLPAGTPWPDRNDGTQVALPEGTLAPSERIVVALNGEEADIAAARWNEGVISLWQENVDEPLERIDFMHWPEGAVMSRQPDGTGRHVFCSDDTKGHSNDACTPVLTRAVESHLRHLRTPGDFEMLAAGDTRMGVLTVKQVVDLLNNDQSYLLKSERWDIHYTFVREVIEGNEPLNRCDEADEIIFDAGRDVFNDINYYSSENRQYLLGSLVHHTGANLHTFEYVSDRDAITGELMKRGFFAAMERVQIPTQWSFRPENQSQVDAALTVDGEMPIVTPSAPYQNRTYQPLNDTVGYGVLTFISAAELDNESLGPQVILVTDAVPNDIPLAAGVITESFQTPLSHVNVLSKSRGTPNMALVKAREDERIAAHLGELVRLEVGHADFDIRVADAAEAQTFWESAGTDGPLQIPILDDSVLGIVALQDASLADTPIIGAKAAGLAELTSLSLDCDVPLVTPRDSFAIPVSHYLKHFESSGAAERLAQLRADDVFQTNPDVRREGLAEVRAMIMTNPVASDLLQEVTSYIAETFGTARVRFRSSSNTEDLDGFSGAGLYTSVSGAVDDPERPIDDAIRTVWASLWNMRAYDERAYYHVSQDDVAMGILCHEAFLSEKANGVAISRDINRPWLGSFDYVNVQFGEASVTNPAPGISADLFIHHYWLDPSETYYAQSTFMNGEKVLTDTEVDNLHCVLRGIQKHLRPLYDPNEENDRFTIDIEFKLIEPDRTLLVKQARPYSFGNVEIAKDCP